MSNRFVKPPPPPAPPFSRWRKRLWALSITAPLLFAVSVYLAQEPSSLEEHLSEVQSRTERALVLALNARPLDLASDLAALERSIKRDRARLSRRLRKDDEQTTVLHQQAARVRDELERLIAHTADWKRRLRQAPKSQRAETAMAIKIDILGKRKGWPILTERIPIPRLNPHRMVQWALQGARAGALWPVGLTQRLTKARGTYYQRAVYVFFPPPANDAPIVPYLTGFGFACVLTGYLLCWLGVRIRRHILADLGLVYLFYTLAYSLGVISLNLGLL